MKETIMKVKWDMMQNEDKEKNKSLADIAIDCILYEDYGPQE